MTPTPWRGVSPVTPLLVAIQGVLWVYYNGSVGAWWGAAPNFFIVPFSLFTLWVLRKAKRQRQALVASSGEAATTL